MNNSWTICAQADTNHPNRRAFTGVLTQVDVASDKAPSGARGHRVILTRAAAEAALPSLIGMAVDFKAGFDGHDSRQKVGIITSAKVNRVNLIVHGFVYAKDFPDLITELSKPRKMGMSYELDSAHVTDMLAPVWTLNRATFTGAAILYADKAAYTKSRFTLKATA